MENERQYESHDFSTSGMVEVLIYMVFVCSTITTTNQHKQILE